jgi:hypothetical protein
VDIVLSSSKKTHLSLVLCSLSLCNTPNVCVERGHSGQNRNNLGQLPNTSIILQEVIVILCVELVFVVLLLWSVSWLCFVVVVGEVWERSGRGPPGSFLIFFRVCCTDILSQFPVCHTF